MAITLRKVLVRRMVFTRIYNALKLRQYLIYCVATGRASVLYKDPNIPTSFYDEGQDAVDAIQLAMDNYSKKPTKGNFKAIKIAVDKGKVWLNEYADKVEMIANDNANRNTLDEASGNILYSYLSSRKVGKSKKGNPQKPLLVWKAVGEGNIRPLRKIV